MSYAILVLPRLTPGSPAVGGKVAAKRIGDALAPRGIVDHEGIAVKRAACGRSPLQNTGLEPPLDQAENPED
jgi:hypothetical protein